MPAITWIRHSTSDELLCTVCKEHGTRRRTTFQAADVTDSSQATAGQTDLDEIHAESDDTSGRGGARVCDTPYTQQLHRESPAIVDTVEARRDRLLQPS